MLLLPFTAVGLTDRREWIGRGVLTSLQADLSRLPTVQPITLDLAVPENAPPAAGYDTELVLKLARSANARYAIFGTYQTNDPELRLVGVIIDVSTGQPVGGMKATGTVRDIFGMEDSIAMQAKRQLPQVPEPVAMQPAVNAPAIPAPPIAPPPPNNNNWPVRNPFPAAAFDEDAATRTLDRLRYRDDWDYPGYIGPYFGGIPFTSFGLGWGGRFHHRSTVNVSSSGNPSGRSVGNSTVTVAGNPSVTSVVTTTTGDTVVRNIPIRVYQNDSGNLFRGGGYLDTGAVANRSTGRNYAYHGGNFVWPAVQTGNYIHPTEQSGNYVRATPQTGNYVRPTPQTGNYVHPTPQTGNAVQPVR